MSATILRKVNDRMKEMNIGSDYGELITGRALEEVRKIGCENLFYRSDIGMKALSFLVKK